MAPLRCGHAAHPAPQVWRHQTQSAASACVVEGITVVNILSLTTPLTYVSFWQWLAYLHDRSRSGFLVKLCLFHATTDQSAWWSRSLYTTCIGTFNPTIPIYYLHQHSVRCNQPTVFFSHQTSTSHNNQQYFSLTINQHQPPATVSRTEWLHNLKLRQWQHQVAFRNNLFSKFNFVLAALSTHFYGLSSPRLFGSP